MFKVVYAASHLLCASGQAGAHAEILAALRRLSLAIRIELQPAVMVQIEPKGWIYIRAKCHVAVGRDRQEAASWR
jgi:hypothetical protein